MRLLVRGLLTIAVVLATCAAVIPALPAVAATSAKPSTYDRSIGRADCALLGRRYVAGSGCSRKKCVAPAFLDKGLVNAEKCALPRQRGYTFGAPLDFARCSAMHRRWVEQVNWCAANPDRRVRVIRNAPQCVAPHTTYVSHDETEGYYDECLRPARVRTLKRLARQEGISLTQSASRRSRALCAYRPQHVFAEGRCVDVGAPTGRPGGTVLIGDSIGYRGSDELAARTKRLVLDAYPGRRMSDLEERLENFRRGHGEPDGVIVELGTNAARTTRSEMRRIVATLPPTTTLMLVVPYRAASTRTRKAAPFTVRYGRLMRTIATERPRTCVADWAAVVAQRPWVLVDGVHPTRAGEDVWARWITRSWQGCRASIS